MSSGGARTGAGRPKGSKNRVTEKYRKQLAFICREHSVEAVETLVTIMKDITVNPAARVRAAENLLDRGYGKPPQQVILEPDEGKPLSELTDEELNQFIIENEEAALLEGGPTDEDLEWDDPSHEAQKIPVRVIDEEDDGA